MLLSICAEINNAPEITTTDHTVTVAEDAGINYPVLDVTVTDDTLYPEVSLFITAEPKEGLDLYKPVGEREREREREREGERERERERERESYMVKKIGTKKMQHKITEALSFCFFFLFRFCFCFLITSV